MVCSQTPMTIQDVSIPADFNFAAYEQSVKKLFREKYDDFSTLDYNGVEESQDFSNSVQDDVNRFTKELLVSSTTSSSTKKGLHRNKVFSLFTSNALSECVKYLHSLINDAEIKVLVMEAYRFLEQLFNALLPNGRCLEFRS